MIENSESWGCGQGSLAGFPPIFLILRSPSRRRFLAVLLLGHLLLSMFLAQLQSTTNNRHLHLSEWDTPSPTHESTEWWRGHWLRELELSLFRSQSKFQQNRFHTGLKFRYFGLRCHEQGSSCTRLSRVFLFAVVSHGAGHWWPVSVNHSPYPETCRSWWLTRCYGLPLHNVIPGLVQPKAAAQRIHQLKVKRNMNVKSGGFQFTGKQQTQEMFEEILVLLVCKCLDLLQNEGIWLSCINSLDNLT